MPCLGSRKCLHCHTFFKPTPQSKGRQKYCSDVACKKASKQASQHKWLSKPENVGYFKGKTNVQRVQQWRAKNPDYWKKPIKCLDNGDRLQEALMMQPIDKQKEIANLKENALQELLIAQPFVLIGLIAHLTGSALQDDIVSTGQKLRQLGEDFLHNPNLNQGEHDDYSSLTQSKTVSPDPITI
jgi:hypothetical protein